MPTPNSGNNPLDALIAEYLEAVDRGQQPDRQQFIDAHPEHATELKAFFADLDKLESTKLHARLQLDATIIPQHEPKPGTIIAGRYKLLENIGEGGMGSVWVAEQQQPVKRRVAIKLVKAGMDSKQVLARFEAERQALALMDHPNRHAPALDSAAALALPASPPNAASIPVTCRNLLLVTSTGS